MVDPQASPQRIQRLTPLADALACIDRLVAPVAPKMIAAKRALGRTLAADVTITHAQPAAALALRDGFAVRADATLDASAYAPVLIEGAMVDVGDPLPAGTDTVAPPEAVELRGGSAHAVAALAPGDGVLPDGADMAEGAVRPAGTRLRGSDLAALAMLGVELVRVREPRLRVVPVRPPGDRVIDGVADLLVRDVLVHGRAFSQPCDNRGLDGAFDPIGEDAMIVVGGSGSGRRDRSVHTLAHRGSVAFHGVGVSPGETAAFGMIGQRPVLVVPGRLDAALAVWLLLGRRLLARLCGRDEEERGKPVTLTRKISSTLGLAELVPVRREADGAAPLASGYLSPQSLAQADGYVIVPADSEGFPAGAQVEMRTLP